MWLTKQEKLNRTFKRAMAKRNEVDIEQITEVLKRAWKDAANHDKLDFEEVTAIRAAYRILEKITACGRSLEDFLSEMRLDQ